MKAIMITYHIVLAEEILATLDRLDVRGFTRWSDIQGRGSHTGVPQMGSHTWPGLNGAMLCVVEDEQTPPLLEALKELDEEERGLRAFVWPIEQML